MADVLFRFCYLCQSSGLSTLPNNPGDSRFWTVSPGLQIRVWNLPDNRRSLPFLVDSTFWLWNFKIFCVVWAILLLTTSNVSSQTPVFRFNMSNSVIGGSKLITSNVTIPTTSFSRVFFHKWCHVPCIAEEELSKDWLKKKTQIIRKRKR